jgi:hypothetical protein
MSSSANSDNKLCIWTVYRKGSIQPFLHNFVAREVAILAGETIPTGQIMAAPDVEMIREELRRRGFTVMPRWEDDHESIIESWI